MRTKAPCFGCDHRKLYCRRDCVPWLDWQIKHAEEKAEYDRARQRERIFEDIAADAPAKYRRYNNEKSCKKRRDDHR